MKTNATSKQQEEISYGLKIAIVTRVREIVGDFKVRRALPSFKRRMVGPFKFIRLLLQNLVEWTRRIGQTQGT